MFKIDEEVICVDTGGYKELSLGGIYKIKAADIDNFKVERVQIQDVSGWFMTTRFKSENETKMNDAVTTLPTDSKTRKNYPLFAGCVRYFPAALSGVALISKRGNDKHNPGQELHHDRNKSMDHNDCILRHLIDAQDLLARLERNQNVEISSILEEVSQMAWRALAYSQEIHERFGAPLAPGAKK